MYGVFWITPPHDPAMMVAAASVSRMSRVRYSSPAALADSVVSMPPTTVARANGRASGRYAIASGSAGTHARVGQGRARATDDTGSGAAPAPPPAISHRPQKTAVPARTAANAPGSPHGILMPPINAASTSARDTSPTSGSENTLSAGRNAMSRIATPAIEPR